MAEEKESKVEAKVEAKAPAKIKGGVSIKKSLVNMMLKSGNELVIGKSAELSKEEYEAILKGHGADAEAKLWEK